MEELHLNNRPTVVRFRCVVEAAAVLLMVALVPLFIKVAAVVGGGVVVGGWVVVANCVAEVDIGVPAAAPPSSTAEDPGTVVEG